MGRQRPAGELFAGGGQQAVEHQPGLSCTGRPGDAGESADREASREAVEVPQLADLDL